MTDFRNEHPRLIALIVVVIGILLSLWVYHTYQTGGSIADSIIILSPVLVIYGLAGLIVPRLHQAMTAQSDAGPAYRIAGFIILGLAVLVGLYVRNVIFKDWK